MISKNVTFFLTAAGFALPATEGSGLVDDSAECLAAGLEGAFVVFDTAGAFAFRAAAVVILTVFCFAGCIFSASSSSSSRSCGSDTSAATGCGFFLVTREARFFGSLATDELHEVEVAIRLVDDLVAAVALIGTIFISSSLELSASSRLQAAVLVLAVLRLPFFRSSEAEAVFAFEDTALVSGFVRGLPLLAVVVVVVEAVAVTLASSLVVVLRTRARVTLLGGDCGVAASVSIARRAMFNVYMNMWTCQAG